MHSRMRRRGWGRLLSHQSPERSDLSSDMCELEEIVVLVAVDFRLYRSTHLIDNQFSHAARRILPLETEIKCLESAMSQNAEYRLATFLSIQTSHLA